LDDLLLYKSDKGDDVVDGDDADDDVDDDAADLEEECIFY